MKLTINIENEAMGHAMAEWFKGGGAIFAFNESTPYYKAMTKGADKIENPECIVEQTMDGYRITIIPNE